MSTNSVRVFLQVRHDTAANWTRKNPLLLAGEYGLETDTYLIKIGDGTTQWNNLRYLNKLNATYFKNDIDGTLTFSDTFMQDITNLIINSGGSTKIVISDDPEEETDPVNLRYLQSAINDAIQNAHHLKRSVVNNLPPILSADPDTLYMVQAESGDHYDEYMLIGNKWEMIGSTDGSGSGGGSGQSEVLLQYDTYDNWKVSNIILKEGEIAVSVSTQDNTIEGTNDRPTNTPPAVGLKIGDGYHTFRNLPWVQAVAGDVYTWAKEALPPSASNIPGLKSYLDQYVEENGLNGGGSGGGGGGDVTVVARTYRLYSGTGNNLHKYYLQYKNANDSEWTTDELNYIDLSSFEWIIEWLGDAPENFWNINGYVINKLNEQLNNIYYQDVEDITKVVTAVNQNNGKISVIHRPLAAENLSGILSVENGGTGRSSLEYDSVLIGNGTGAIITKTLENTLTNNTNLATNRAIINYINNATAGLTGAMHFIGEASNEIVNGSATIPTISSRPNYVPQDGDVVLYDSAEYVWNGSNWSLLGDESSYAIKGSITNEDIADEAAIDPLKIAGLTENNLVNELNTKVDKVDNKQLSTEDFTTDFMNKLKDIEDYAERNIIQHVFVNGTEATIGTVEGKERSLSLRLSALTPQEEEIVSSIEMGAQANRIEHIFLNEDEIQIGTVRGLAKSVNIDITDITDKLSTIEPGAEVNAFDAIRINDVLFSQINEDKELQISLNPSVLGLNIVEGARYPTGPSTYTNIDISYDKKLELSKVAATGNIGDLVQEANTYVIFNCGSSTTVMDT